MQPGRLVLGVRYGPRVGLEVDGPDVHQLRQARQFCFKLFLRRPHCLFDPLALILHALFELLDEAFGILVLAGIERGRAKEAWIDLIRWASKLREQCVGIHLRRYFRPRA